MTKDEALYSFYSSFDLPTYDENTVPTDAKMPYITYNVALDRIGNTVYLSASLWYRSNSWVKIQSKAAEIAKRLSNGGVILPLNEGYLWLVQGSPFSQRMSEPSDNEVRRIVLNIQAEFLTSY